MVSHAKEWSAQKWFGGPLLSDKNDPPLTILV